MYSYKDGISKFLQKSVNLNENVAEGSLNILNKLLKFNNQNNLFMEVEYSPSSHRNTCLSLYTDFSITLI